MIYKRRMLQVIPAFVVAITASLVVVFSHAASSLELPDTVENGVKRFNLQDLLAAQGIQGVQRSENSQSHDATPKTQTIDIAELLAAAQKASTNQKLKTQEDVHKEEIVSKFTENKKPVDIDLSSDKNGNLNLANLPGLSGSKSAGETNTINLNDLQALLSKQKQVSDDTSSKEVENHVVKEEIDLGTKKLEIEAAGKRATRYTLAKGPDGGLNLIPIVDDESGGHKIDLMQPKEYEEKGRSRQQMQLTTLSQAMYSPFPSDQNILHLHLKGKDGKDGKPGNKGPMGPFGPKGPEGAKGDKGDPGTCSSQINGLFECTPDELDSLSNRIDYLEKICKKVENAAKKHKLTYTNHSKISDTLTGDTSAKERTATSITKDSSENQTPRIELSENGSAKREKVDSEKDKSVTVKEKEPSSLGNKDDSKSQDAVKSKMETVRLKLEKTEETTGDTRGKKLEQEKSEKADSEKASSAEKKSFEESRDEKSKSSEVQASEIIKKPNTESSVPSLRSMIDIKAKLKIAELDLMDRVKAAKDG